MLEEPQSQRIDTPPDAKRQAELEAAYQQNIAAEKDPYEGTRIATYGELLWIFEHLLWSGGLFLPEGPEGMERPNLSGANLKYVNLSGARLEGTNLSRAALGGANLRGASLVQANLSGASLGGVNLSGATLVGANLSGASLVQANLSGANLMLANLSGALLSFANLSGADLRGAKFDSDTNLAESTLSSATTLGDIRWSEVNLSQLNWEPVQRLGDDDKKYPDDTARAYRQVATQLRSQGMNEVADRFAYQAQRWQRRILRQRLRWINPQSLGPYLGSLLLWVVAGYGYRPGRTLLSYLVVVLGFATLFFVGTHNVDTHLANLTWNEALILSLTSFHGRGFFPGSLPLGDWAAGVAAAEAVIGLFIELILIATFSRRFLGN